MMERISSRSTFFGKRVFPFIWFGLLSLFIIAPLRAKGARGSVPPAIFIGPAVLAAFGYFLMKKTVFDLADEVYDAGDSLIVRFGNEEERIPLSEIINLSYSYLSNPSRATLTLRTPGRFGKEITFSPPQRFLPFGKNPIITNLIERIDAARRA